MKKIILFPIALLIVICLSACNNSISTPNPDTIVIDIKNNTNIDINGIELSWFQNGRITGTQGAMNADGSKIKKGKSLSFELTKEDVVFKDDVLFGVALLPTKRYLDKIQLNSTVSLDLLSGNKYYLEITQDAEGNFHLILNN